MRNGIAGFLVGLAFTLGVLGVPGLVFAADLAEPQTRKIQRFLRHHAAVSEIIFRSQGNSGFS